MNRVAILGQPLVGHALKIREPTRQGVGREPGSNPPRSRPRSPAPALGPPERPGSRHRESPDPPGPPRFRDRARVLIQSVTSRSPLEPSVAASTRKHDVQAAPEPLGSSNSPGDPPGVARSGPPSPRRPYLRSPSPDRSPVDTRRPAVEQAGFFPRSDPRAPRSIRPLTAP